MSENSVKVTLYKWAGAWGPFKVTISCGECTLTKNVIDDTLENELVDIPVEFEVKDWLSVWWEPLPKGGWHAPIVMVEGKIICQGHALNRGILTQTVIEAHAKTNAISGTHIFGKESCPHCTRAKGYLGDAGIDHVYHDVVKEPKSLYEMISRVQPFIPPKTPITVPQIWIDGKYIGGADQLSKIVEQAVQPNTDRGHSSMVPSHRAITV